MNKYLYITFLLLMAGGLSSCSFHKRVAGKKVKSYDMTQGDSVRTSHARIIYPQPDTAAGATDTLNQVNRLVGELTPLWQKRFAYKTFSGKAKMHYEGPDDKQEFTAHFRVRKDSLIWVAITGLGGMVPVARIYITPDSFIMVNQLQKEVTRIPLSEAAKILPTKVDFASLQRLIVGEPLRDGTITHATSFGGAWSLQVEDSNYIQVVTYNKADSTMRTGQLSTRDPKGPQAMIQYGGYELEGIQKVSTNRVLHIQNGNDVHTLDMNFTKIDFDQQLDFPVSVPTSYTPKALKK